MRKLLLSLAVAAFAALGAVSVYADNLSCADWSYNNPQCAEYVQGMAGKAAFGMPATQERVKVEGLACSDWSYNDALCSSYLTHEVTGKAAFGRETGVKRAVSTPVCFDWSFNAICRGRTADDLIE